MGSFAHGDCAGRMKSIQNYHMDTQKWADIAYNFVVCPHGYVFEGRGVGKRSAANGDYDSNSASYAICYLSGEGDAFTAEAKTAINEAALLLVPAGPIWKRHRDWVATACPGDEISAWVSSGHQAAAVPVPVPATPPAPKPEEAPMAVRYSLPNGQIYVTDGLSRRYVGSPLDNDVLNDIGCKLVSVDAAHAPAFHSGLHSLDTAAVDVQKIVEGVLAGINVKVDSSVIAAAVVTEFQKRLVS